MCFHSFMVKSGASMSQSIQFLTSFSNSVAETMQQYLSFGLTDE